MLYKSRFMRKIITLYYKWARTKEGKQKPVTDYFELRCGNKNHQYEKL